MFHPNLPTIHFGKVFELSETRLPLPKVKVIGCISSEMTIFESRRMRTVPAEGVQRFRGILWSVVFPWWQPQVYWHGAEQLAICAANRPQHLCRQIVKRGWW